MSQTTPITHSYTGWMDDNWQATDRVDVAQLVYKPCGEERNFNINTELRVNAGTSNPQTMTSFATMDSTDADVTTEYPFHWKSCP